MPNALATPPTAPQDGNAPQGAPGNALQGQAPAPMPAPTHAQTVAALRHFSAIEKELEPLLKNPDLGKSSIKSAIIDAATKLVASRMMTPAQAVMQLGTVPDEPLQQRKWVQDHWDSANKGRDAVLDHHRMAFTGAPEEAMEQGSPDEHMAQMSSLMSTHYAGKSNG